MALYLDQLLQKHYFFYQQNLLEKESPEEELNSGDLECNPQDNFGLRFRIRTLQKLSSARKTVFYQ